ncbi:hypothetical protein PQD71_gp163 [Kosakonia phage Kc263]|uniref:Uncharacterized protein n=1 Tax=Kosakonia phage Kc263 TaxID=2863194 RepID=A0AAE7WGS8_9CAUD|nr:hypothetical protein PQD71_gp163 [Kosakonia phage Kc263]QYN80056.1 hypothetical protein [Kosakonia phage Kc263]
MLALTITNGLLRSIARTVKQEAINEIAGTVRSVFLKNVQFTPTITFIEDIENGGTLVEVWVNKKKMASLRYSVTSEKSWAQLDNQFEYLCYIGLVNYFYGVLEQNTNLEEIIRNALLEGNFSVKLPNGQTLKSEVAHGAYERIVSLAQSDNYPICSLPVDITPESVTHILSNVKYHWRDPGRLCPDDHSIMLEESWLEPDVEI